MLKGDLNTGSHPTHAHMKKKRLSIKKEKETKGRIPTPH